MIKLTSSEMLFGDGALFVTVNWVGDTLPSSWQFLGPSKLLVIFPLAGFCDFIKLLESSLLKMDLKPWVMLKGRQRLEVEAISSLSLCLSSTFTPPTLALFALFTSAPALAVVVSPLFFNFSFDVSAAEVPLERGPFDDVHESPLMAPPLTFALAALG